MSTPSLWTFDVALSFAGADRDQARLLAEALRERKLTVFYDEWFKAQIWGSDLIVLLRDIYLRARVCVPLISKSYVNGPYPRHELRTMLERELQNSAGSLLPVRLDETDVPGLSTTVAFLSYVREGPEGLADLITTRLRLPNGTTAWASVQSAQAKNEQHIIRLKTHLRQPASDLLVVTAPELIDLSKDPLQYASPEMRVLLAKQLVIYLNWKCHARLGIPYGAWKDGNRLFLSTLPDFYAPQRTLEFETAPSGDLHLVSEWISDDERYAAFKYWEWQPAVKGLTADRSDLLLDREVAIMILEKKGALFGFPIVPLGDQPEKLCGWLAEEPPDYLDWGRDPRLVPEGFGPWQAVEHRPTGVAMLVFTLHGRWSAAGFRAFIEAMRFMLPTRHRFRVGTPGAFRVSVLLRVTGTGDGDDDVEYLRAAIDRTYASIARMVAAARRLPLPTPDSGSALSALSQSHAVLFREADAALGKAEFVDTTDRSEAAFHEATWTLLRQSFNNAGDIFYGFDPAQFNFGDVVLLEDIRRYVGVHEGSGS